MRDRRSQTTNQKMSAQSASATGAAYMTPRAKLPRFLATASSRRADPCELTRDEDSFAMTALSIMVIDLLLSTEKFHRGISQSTQYLQNLSRRGKFRNRIIGRGKLAQDGQRAFHRRHPIIQELEDLLFIARVMLTSPRNGRSGRRYLAAKRIISRRKKRRSAVRLAAFIALSLCAPRMALAQAPDVITPIELFDPDSGDGVRVSPGFILYPQVTADLTYDSNVYNVDTAEIEDVFASLRPAFALKSDFARHAMSLEARGELRRYFDTSAENSEAYDLLTTTLLELGYGIDVETYLGYARGIERRGTLGDAFLSDEPVAFHEKRAGIEISRTGNTLELSASAGVLKRDYSDTRVGGVPIDLSLRDVKVTTGSLRADLGLSARTKAFIEVGGNLIDYETPTVPPRDSSGLSVLTGVRHELTSLIEVEVGAGYIRQDFDDNTVPTASEFNYRFTASWTPQPEWRLTAGAARTVDASRSQEAPAIISSSFTLGAERVFGDRLLVGVEAGFVEENYRGSPRKDERFVASTSATYRLAEKIGLTASAGYRDQNGGAFGRSYEGFSAAVGVRAAW